MITRYLPTPVAIERTLRGYDLPAAARTNIRTWLGSKPIPVARCGYGVRGIYASRVMGCMLYYRSHRCGLPFLQLADYVWDTRVLLDRPCTLKLTYRGADGHPRSVPLTPDYLFVGEGRAELVECRSERYLCNASNPVRSRCQLWRYERQPNGHWRCPTAEVAAAALGLGFRVFSSSEVPAIRLANMLFLADYNYND